MNSTLPLNRRAWLQRGGTALAGLALGARFLDSDLCAQTVSPERLAAAGPSKARLSLNENPLGPAPSALAAMTSALQSGKAARYPYLEVGELAEAIAAKEGVPVDHIVLAVGSGEILETLGVHFGLAKKAVVRGDPGYLQMSAAAKAVGGRDVPVAVNARLEHDLDAMLAQVGADTGVVYLANPNNPTGTVVPSAQIRDFVHQVGRKALVVVDEAYLDIADDYAGRTVVDLVRKGENVIVLRTFSKIYGLAGLRVGYGVAAPALVSLIKSYGGGSLSYLGVAAALASLRETGYVLAARERLVAERAKLTDALKALGLRYAEPQANFVFFRTGRPYADVAGRFRADGVAIARAFPPLLDWVRVSIGTPEENTLARDSLRGIFAQS